MPVQSTAMSVCHTGLAAARSALDEVQGSPTELANDRVSTADVPEAANVIPMTDRRRVTEVPVAALPMELADDGRPDFRTRLAAAGGDPHWLRRLRLAHGLSRRRLVLAMARVAKAEGVLMPARYDSTLRYVTGWDNGHLPGPFYAELLRRVFDLPRPEGSWYPTELRLLKGLR